MKHIFLSQQKGFTLIELLVVISIIGVLSSVVLSSLNAARARSRDARRLQDLVQMRTALELYAQDHQGNYPINTESDGITPTVDSGNPLDTWIGTTAGCSRNINGRIIANGLVPTYIAKIPEDPNPNINAGKCYLYYSTGTDYELWVNETVETIGGYPNPNTQNPPHPLRYPKAVKTKSLSVYSPGAVSPVVW